MGKITPPPIADYMDQLFPAQKGERDLDGLRVVSIERVKPRLHQPRRFFDRSRLAELAADIRKTRESGGGIGGTGILQPLLVTVAPDGRGYLLTAGERRWRAAQEAENAEVPVLIREQSNDEAFEDALRENIQREDLTVLEEAEALRHIMDQRKLSIRQAAERFGKDKGWLENRLRLLKAGPDVQEMVSLRKDALSHAYVIDQVKDPKLRRQLIKSVQDEAATVAAVRRRIEEFTDRRGRRVTIEHFPDLPDQSALGPAAPLNPIGGLNPVPMPKLPRLTATTARFLQERLPEEIEDPVIGTLRPAALLAGEAARRLEEVSLSPDYRNALRGELTKLEAQVAKLRKLLK